jgi:hypothetical protein
MILIQLVAAILPPVLDAIDPQQPDKGSPQIISSLSDLIAGYNRDHLS